MRKTLVTLCAFLVMAFSTLAQEGWLLHGSSQSNQRFSPLNQVNEKTVSRLGLLWSQELGTSRGLEATPIVVDGVIYATGSWSVVFAFDAKTGKLKWTYDPHVHRERAYFFCCDVVNRGAALYGNLVIFGTLDALRPTLFREPGRSGTAAIL